MPILTLLARLGLDGRMFKSGIRDAKKEVQDFGKDLKRYVAGAFTAAAMIEASRRTVQFGGAIADLNKRTGASKKALQEQLYAAEQNGAGLEDLTHAYKDLAASRVEALGGDITKKSIFEQLGFSEDEIANLPIEQMMSRIGESIQKNDFGIGESPLIEKILGRGGVKLIATFKDGMGDLAAEANRVGAVLDDEVIDSLDRIGDTLDQLKAQLRGPVAQAVSYIAQLFLNVTRGFQTGVLGPIIHTKAAIDYIKAEKASGRKEPTMQEALAATMSVRDDYLKEINPPPQTPYERTKRTANLDAAGDQKRVTDEVNKELQLRREILELTQRAGQVGQTDEQKREEIVKRIKVIQSQLAALSIMQAVPGGAKSGLDVAGLDLYRQLAEQAVNLSALDNKPNTEHFDNLARIGGFVGGAGSDMRSAVDDIRKEVKALNAQIRQGIFIRGEN